MNLALFINFFTPVNQQCPAYQSMDHVANGLQPINTFHLASAHGSMVEITAHTSFLELNYTIIFEK